jgi:protein AaeX
VSFTEIDLFGIYVAPMAVMMVGAWLILLPLRRLADHFDFERQVWHPALFVFAVYLIILSSTVLLTMRWAAR